MYVEAILMYCSLNAHFENQQYQLDSILWCFKSPLTYLNSTSIAVKFNFCIVFNWKSFIYSSSSIVSGNSNNIPFKGSQNIGPANFSFFFMLSWKVCRILLFPILFLHKFFHFCAETPIRKLFASAICRKRHPNRPFLPCLPCFLKG